MESVCSGLPRNAPPSAATFCPMKTQAHPALCNSLCTSAAVRSRAAWQPRSASVKGGEPPHGRRWKSCCVAWSSCCTTHEVYQRPPAIVLLSRPPVFRALDSRTATSCERRRAGARNCALLPFSTGRQGQRHSQSVGEHTPNQRGARENWATEWEGAMERAGAGELSDQMCNNDQKTRGAP